MLNGPFQALIIRHERLCERDGDAVLCQRGFQVLLQTLFVQLAPHDFI